MCLFSQKTFREKAPQITRIQYKLHHTFFIISIATSKGQTYRKDPFAFSAKWSKKKRVCNFDGIFQRVDHNFLVNCILVANFIFYFFFFAKRINPFSETSTLFKWIFTKWTIWLFFSFHYQHATVKCWLWITTGMEKLNWMMNLR